MKRTLLALAVFTAARLFGQSIPNGGFESWNNGTFMDPQYYTSSNDQFNGNAISNFMANSVQVSPAYHGNYAVQLSTIKNGNDTIAAYVVDGNPNGPNVYGGIPYTQKPTGIRFYYKYSTASTDSALVIAWFKKAGSVIGTFQFKVATVSNVYKLYTGAFIPALASTPDTVVFAAASSVTVMNQSIGAPVGSVFTIDSVSFTGAGSQPAEFNGDFENWNPLDTVFIPASWYINGNVRWSSDAYAGNHSAEMITANTPYGVNTGSVSTGYYQCPKNCMMNCKCYLKGGFAYTQTNDSLTFWYKYAPMGGPDTAVANLSLIKDSVFYQTGINLFGTAGAWRYATIPVNPGQAPDTAVVSFQSSMNSIPSHIGSVLKVDNVQFKSQPLAIKNLHNLNGGISVYPNPNHGVFQVAISQQASANSTIEVYNMLGEKVYSNSYQPIAISHQLIQIDLSAQPAGVYLLRVINSNGALAGTQQIVKF